MPRRHEDTKNHKEGSVVKILSATSSLGAFVAKNALI